MPAGFLSSEQINLYKEQGYLVVRNFCSKTEVDKLYNTALQDVVMKNKALDLNDQSGKKTKLSLWFTPGNNVFDYLTRSRKMVNAVQQLLGDKAAVCHFHSNMLHRSEANL